MGHNRFILILILVILTACLPVFLLFPSQLNAEIYGVTCSDGTHHPPGFDCEAYIRGKNKGKSSVGPGDRRGKKGPDNRRQQWEKDQELERQRQIQQQLLEEEARKKREEDRKRQFEQDKQKALKMLKSGSGKLGVKGDSGGSPTLKTTTPVGTGLKEPLFSKGTKGSAPPYLGGLDSKRPIVVEPSKVQGGTPEALLAANRKTHVLLDALEANPRDWKGSIRYLQNRLADSPNDLAVRDALNLVRGYYQGYLGSRVVADNHYKYGVRKWLEGDFDQAARSFARAYRENPDDKLLLRSFAHSLGLRNNSGKCRVSGGCSFFDIPKKSIVDDSGIASEIRQRMKEARAAVSANPANLELWATLNYLEGMAGYNDYLDIVLDKKTPPLNKADLVAIEAGLKKVGEKDYVVDGWQAFAKAWGKNADEDMVMFAINYAKGLASSQRGEADYFPYIPDRLKDKRTEEAYNEHLERISELFYPELSYESKTKKAINDFSQQVKDTEKQNPFFGILFNKEVKQIKEKWSSFFR